MPNTYVALATQTLGTAASSVTFSSIPQGYTDLVLIGNGTLASNGTMNIKLNSDTGSNYSRTEIYGDGSSAASYRESNQSTQNFANWDTTGSNFIMHLQNYSNTTTNKTCITRYNRTSSLVAANVILYRSTSAISNIVITGGSNIQIGSTFSLYGIANADQGSAKATGGIITEDSQYWYHTFAASGTFTPKQALTCDYLVVAGGGGGGGSTGGGGGAGGFRTATSQSLSAISYPVTVGSGGAGSTSGGNGATGNVSSVNSFQSAGGGFGSGYNGGAGGNAGAGGSGGGGGSISNGGAGNTPSTSPSQGNNGGNSFSASWGGGGGGGAGAVGSAGVSGFLGGAGGIGSFTALSGGVTTGVGILSSGNYYLAAGGGGCGQDVGAVGGIGGGGNGGGNNPSVAATSAIANTGSGGGGARDGGSGIGGNGGSGVVIVRYAK